MLMISALVVFSGCKKDDDESDDTNATSTVELSCVVDGVAWSVSMPGGAVDEGELWITGSNSVGTIDFFLSSTIAAGTYNNNSAEVYTMMWINESSAEQFNANPGTLVITSHDVSSHRIEGTFEGPFTSIASNTVTITNGVFKINYTVLPS